MRWQCYLRRCPRHFVAFLCRVHADKNDFARAPHHPQIKNYRQTVLCSSVLGERSLFITHTNTNINQMNGSHLTWLSGTVVAASEHHLAGRSQAVMQPLAGWQPVPQNSGGLCTTCQGSLASEKDVWYSTEFMATDAQTTSASATKCARSVIL